MTARRIGTRHDTVPVLVRTRSIRVSPTTSITAWCLRRLILALAWMLRHPGFDLAAAATVLCAWLTAQLGPLADLAVADLIAFVLAFWRRRWPEGFEQSVTWPLRGVFRGWWIYRTSWRVAMMTAGLSLAYDDREFVPRMVSVRSSRSVDQVTIKMLPGQTLDDWVQAAPRLAPTFGALDVRVRSVPGSPRELVLWLLVVDPLEQDVAPLAGDDADFAALPVALREDGLTYRLRLLGSHVLVAGATGSGKGSVIWSTLAALGPAIHAGLAEIWVVDPKGGMELAFGAPLFARFVYGDADSEVWERDFADLLEDLVQVMRRRQSALRGRTRLHTPTTEEPFIVLVVDEMASLTAYCNDRDAKRRIATALSLLLSQGRAVGVTVVGALQDPRKEVLPFRDLFPTRVALRLTESEQVAYVLGAGAKDRGARCDRIPESLPGIGFVAIDGVAEPVRVRFSHITDDHIAELVHRFAPSQVEPIRVDVAA